MALSKFNTDMNIISALATEPNDVGGLTDAELKAKFDAGPNAIKAYINDTLTSEIDAHIATKDEVQGITLGQILDGTITEGKLTAEVNSKIDGKAPAALTAALVAALGLDPGTNPKVADALMKLSKSFRYDTYAWYRWVFRWDINLSSITTYYLSKGYFQETVNITIYYTDAIIIDETTGAITLVNPQSVSCTNQALPSPNTMFANKYIYCSDNASQIFKCSNSSVVTSELYVSGSTWVRGLAISNSQIVSTVLTNNEGNKELLQAESESAYPKDTVSNGYKYLYEGSLRYLPLRAQIATGSYTGTGTVGSSNPNSFVCNFNPKVAVIYAPSDSNVYSAMGIMLLSGSSPRFIVFSYSTYPATNIVSKSGSTLSWYQSGGTNDNYIAMQFNTLGKTYYIDYWG